MNLFTPVTVPDCNKVSFVESAYQLIVNPVEAVAEIVDVSVPHLVAFTTVVTAAGKAFTVAATAVLVAALQLAFLDVA